MRTFHIISYVFMLLFLFSCSDKNITDNDNDFSNAQLNVTFENQNCRKIQFNKTTTINTVKLTVSASDMTTINQDLSLSGNTATGTVSVPKGDSRKFLVEGFDGSNIKQFDGDRTVSIQNDNESITISVSFIPPPVINYSVSEITASSVKVNWDVSNAPDFYEYIVLLGTTSDLDPNNSSQVVTTIMTQSTNQVTINGLDPETDYYVAVITVDTEMYYNTSFTSQPFQTASASSVQEIRYDDDSREGGLRGFANSWLTVTFQSPQYPAKVVSFSMYIYNNSVGSEVAPLIYDNTLGDYIFITTLPATTEGWVEITPDWSNWSSDGTVTDDFDAGLEFEVDQGPYVGCDTNSTYYSGNWYKAPDGSWSMLSEVGYDWNLMIRAKVELSSGTMLELPPAKITIRDKRNGAFLRKKDIPPKLLTADRLLK